MAPSKTQHHRIRFWINNQAYNIYKRDTMFWENRNPTSMKSNTCTDEARFTVQVGFELERGPGMALGQRRKDRAAERGIEQRRREAGVHRADWVVMAELRDALEYRAAVFDLCLLY